MCGIVGVVNRYNHGLAMSQADIFENMLITDTLRGPDSTGLFAVTKAGNANIIKQAAPGWEFIQTSEFKKLKTALIRNYNVVIGHNRKATRGEVKGENAHPFNEGNIWLVHNGTTFGATGKDFEVDSHELCWEINEYGHEAAFGTFNGAFACIWYNKENKRLYAARNEQRPLGIIETDAGWYFCSEPQMAMWLIGRERITGKSVAMLEPGKVYSFDMNSTRRDDFLVESLKPKTQNRYTPIHQSPNPEPVTSNVIEIPRLGHNPDVGKARITEMGGFKEEQDIIVELVDDKYLNDPKTYSQLIFDVMSEKGQSMPNVNALYVIPTAEVEAFYASQYYRARIAGIQPRRPVPKTGPAIDLWLSKHPNHRPEAVEAGKTNNEYFFSEDTFKSFVGIGCKACQRPLLFSEIGDTKAVKQKGTWKFYHRDCPVVGDFGFPNAGIVH